MLEPFRCFAIAAPGLEPLVAKELVTLGEQPRVDDGGVTWTGDARSVMRANLWLRTASRVLIRVAEFRATAFYELEKRAKKIEWDAFVRTGKAVDFRVTARKSKLYHSDGIAERLVKATGRAQADDGQLFIVRVVRDQFTISVDTSGDLLHMRGYRQAVAKAPLRETLAAALLIANDWTGDVPLLDPFCGSGTIPIEAALIARKMPPGLRRSFAFMQWPSFDPAQWRLLVRAAETSVLASSPVAILGSDRDAGAIASARSNAERAGVAADIMFSELAVSAIEPPEQQGLVATNPPYGKRVGDGSSVRNLYAQFGKVLRARCPGWRAAFYSPDPRLAGQVGEPTEVVFRTSTGGIKVAALRAEIASSRRPPESVA